MSNPRRTIRCLRRWLEMRVIEPSCDRGRPWTLRAEDQQTIVGALLLAWGLALVTAVWSVGNGAWISIDLASQRPFDGRISINRCEWPELCVLPGIGETLARRIHQDRQQRGPFASASELDRVMGLGERAVAQIEPWIDTHPPRSHSEVDP